MGVHARAVLCASFSFCFEIRTVLSSQSMKRLERESTQPKPNSSLFDPKERAGTTFELQRQYTCIHKIITV